MKYVVHEIQDMGLFFFENSNTDLSKAKDLIKIDFT